MSLFKARDWWSTLSGYEEDYDLGCLAVGNLDNGSSGLGECSARCRGICWLINYSMGAHAFPFVFSVSCLNGALGLSYIKILEIEFLEYWKSL